MHFIADVNQPYSCQNWGDFHEIDTPLIAEINSTENISVRSWFPTDPITGALYPITIFINHNMQVIHIHHGTLNKSDTDLYIECMLWDLL